MRAAIVYPNSVASAFVSQPATISKPAIKLRPRTLQCTHTASAIHAVQPCTEAARPLGKAVPHDNVEDLQPDSRRQRAVDVRRVEEVPAVPTRGRNHIARDDRAERQAVPGVLLSVSATSLSACMKANRSPAPDHRLRFVDDQKHAAGFAVRF